MMKTLDLVWVGLVMVGACTGEPRRVAPALPAAGMAGSSVEMRQAAGSVAPEPPAEMPAPAGAGAAPNMGGGAAPPAAEGPDAAVADAAPPLPDAAVADGGAIETTYETVKVFDRRDSHPVSGAHVLVHDSEQKLSGVYETNIEGYAIIALPTRGSVTVAYEARYKVGDSTEIMRTITTYQAIPAHTQIRFFVDDPGDRAFTFPTRPEADMTVHLELELPEGTTSVGVEMDCSSGSYRNDSKVTLDFPDCGGSYYDLIATARTPSGRLYGTALDNPYIPGSSDVTHRIAVNRSDYVTKTVTLLLPPNENATVSLMGRRTGRPRSLYGDSGSFGPGGQGIATLQIEDVFDDLHLGGRQSIDLPDRTHLGAAFDRSGPDIADHFYWDVAAVARPMEPVGPPTSRSTAGVLTWTLEARGLLRDAMQLQVGEWTVLRPPSYEGSLALPEWPAELTDLLPTISPDSDWSVSHYDFVEHTGYKAVIEHLEEDLLWHPKNVDYATARQCPRCR